jgi:hypothetical protein
MRRWKPLRNSLIIIVLLSILAGLVFPFIDTLPVYAVDVPRYFVMGQIVVEDGSDGHIAVSPTRVVADGNITVGTAGNIHVYMASGTTGHIDSGTATITGSPVTLSAGLNDITAEGVGDFAIDLTIGTAANWTDHNSWSASTGGACTATEPTSADSAYFDANSFTAASQILTVDATANCLNMDWTGALNTPTFTIAAAQSLGIFGDATFIAAMVANCPTYSYLYFKGATEKTLTTNTLSFTKIVFQVGIASTEGNLKLLDGLTLTGSAGNLKCQRGTLNTNNQTISCAEFGDDAVAQTKTMTLGTSTISCTLLSFTGGALTLTNATHTINISGTGTFTCTAATTGSWGTVNLNGTAHTVSGSNTFVNLTRNGTATKTDTLTLTSGTTQTVTGTCALIGNSATNRLLVQSSTLGTAAILHVTTDVAANWTGTNAVDFMDITSTHAVDLSAAGLNPAAYSGDCGGNTGITFTTSAAQTSGTTDTWSTAAKWTSRVPLPQDDVTCSHNTTVDMPRIGRSITFTGTPTISLSNDISHYGSFTLVSGMTFTMTGGQAVYLRGRLAGMPAGGWTLTSAGITPTFTNIYVYDPTGTYKLMDTTNATVAFVQGSGTLDLNDVAVNTATFSFAYLPSNPRVLYMRGSTVTITSPTAGNRWNAGVGAETTLYAGTSTIVLSNSGANGQTFLGAGLTYNNVRIEGAGAYALTISGNNTFNTFTVDRSVANKTLTLTAGANQTVSSFVCATSGTRVLTINSTAGTATLTKTGGGVIVDYISLANNTGAPAGTWFYGANNTIGANVIDWNATTTPTLTTQAVTSIEENTATGNGNISILGGVVVTRGMQYGTITTVYPSEEHTDGDFATGAFTQTLTGLTEGEQYFVRAYATNGTGSGYGAEVNFLTKPDEPTAFTATMGDEHNLLAWTVGSGSQKIMIRYRTDGSYPTDPANGTQAFFDVGSSYDHTGLTNGTEYKYRGWSYATKGGLTQYSDLYVEATATPLAVPIVTVQAATSVEETTATLNGNITDVNGVNATERGFEYDTNSGAPYSGNIHSHGSYGTGAYTENVAALTQGTLYYERAYAINPVGTGYSAETTFITKPLEPTAFTAVTNGSLAIQLQCVMGTGATGVMIRFRTDGIYPTGIADGNQAYLGTSNIYNHTGLTSGTSYSYRIWSYASGGGLTSYSDLYASTDCTATIAGSVSTGYTYKKAFTVTGSACGAQTNYQIHLTINYGAGADSGLTVYLDSKAQADFDDLRFTATDGVTVLDAWLESKTDSTTASVWVELDTIPVAPGTQVFYMFYGKPSAVSSWSGTNTFVVFDDFERAVDGDTVGGSWTEVTPHGHISTEQDIGNVAGYSGTRSLKLVGGTTPSVTIPVPAGVNNYAFRYQYYKEELASQFFKRGNGTYLIDANYAADEKVTVYDGASYVDTTLTCSKDAWGLAEFENIIWNTTMTVKTNSTAKTGVDISNAAATYSGLVGLTGDATNDEDVWIDNFIVRKYCSAEPTITSWGVVTAVVASLQIQNAKVVTGYSATDDWLVIVRYVNTYAPYYDTYDVRKYFVLQLVNDTNTVIAQSPLLAWGNRVGSIYLSPTVTGALTYGGSYTVRMYGTFVMNPYVEYTLIGSDWLGSDLANLDSWVVTSATTIGTYYATTMTTYIAERGEVLNSTGSGVFSQGVAGLSQVRPALFQTYTVPSTYTPGTITQAGRLAIPAWQTNVGPDATIMLTRLGNIVGIGGDIIAVIAFLIMMFVLMALAFPAGNTTAAMVLSLPMLAGAIWFGMDLLYIGMLALVAAFLFIKNFWLDKGN